MHIRLLRNDDFENGFQECLARLGGMGALGLEQMRSILHEIDRNANHFVFVAVIDGQIVGTTTLLIEQKFIHCGGKVGHIEDVTRRIGYENRGIGKALIDHALSIARGSSCYKVILDCSEENAAIYESFGFRRHELEMRIDL